MRLIAKKRDYYDSVFRQYSYEDKKVFVRKPKDIYVEANLERANLPALKSNDVLHYELKLGAIGFCGKIYPYVKVFDYNNYKRSDSYALYTARLESTNCYYTMDQVESNIKGYSENHLRYSKRHYYNKTPHEVIKKWLEEGKIEKFMNVFCIHECKPILNLFKEHEVAYFQFDLEWHKYQDHPVVLHPVLEDFQFYRVYDMFSAYQAIENYLCNVLVPPDDPYVEPISDVIKAQSKGFDKFSFRKEKTKRK